MKLSVNVSHEDALEVARAAEELGYHRAFVPEGYRSDAPSVLGAIAAVTSDLLLASAVMQIPGRPPAMTALTAATIDHLSAGRFSLGLGVSSAAVATGWYGHQFDQPLSRIREYVSVVRDCLSGLPTTHDGDFYRLPPSGQYGAPVEIMTERLRADIPILLGALGPRSQTLTGEIADGWIGAFVTVDDVSRACKNISSGVKSSIDPERNFDAIVCLPAAVGDTEADAIQTVRGQYAYLMGIGSISTNIYVKKCINMGFGDEAALVHSAWNNANRELAIASVPDEFIRRTALVGTSKQIRQRISEYRAVGASEISLMVSAARTDTSSRIATLNAAHPESMAPYQKP